MNTYEETPLLSGRKGTAFTAVILLHVAFGFALYSELTVRHGRKPDLAPLNLAPMAKISRDSFRPPAVPLIEHMRIYLPPPDFPPLAATEADVAADAKPQDPPDSILQTPPPIHAGVNVRMDPKHPLLIGEAYYPDASRRANEMGRCVVKVTVAIDGRIVAAAIQSSTGFERLDHACLNAVRGQRMLPATEDGKPIESTTSIPIFWNLSDK